MTLCFFIADFSNTECRSVRSPHPPRETRRPLLFHCDQRGFRSPEPDGRDTGPLTYGGNDNIVVCDRTTQSPDHSPPSGLRRGSELTPVGGSPAVGGSPRPRTPFDGDPLDPLAHLTHEVSGGLKHPAEPDAQAKGDHSSGLHVGIDVCAD